MIAFWLVICPLILIEPNKSQTSFDETENELQQDRKFSKAAALDALFLSEHAQLIPTRGAPAFYDVLLERDDAIFIRLGYSPLGEGREIGVYKYTKNGKLWQRKLLYFLPYWIEIH